jgi:hypothetical protein
MKIQIITLSFGIAFLTVLQTPVFAQSRTHHESVPSYDTAAVGTPILQMWNTPKFQEEFLSTLPLLNNIFLPEGIKQATFEFQAASEDTAPYSFCILTILPLKPNQSKTIEFSTALTQKLKSNRELTLDRFLVIMASLHSTGITVRPNILNDETIRIQVIREPMGLPVYEKQRAQLFAESL